MKIIDFHQFMKLPPGTLFAKYHPDRLLDELCIKHDNSGDSDFYVEELLDVECELLRLAEDTGCNVALDAEDAWCRDGLYDYKQLYAVFDNHDVMTFISKLQRCLKPEESAPADGGEVG